MARTAKLIFRPRLIKFNIFFVEKLPRTFLYRKLSMKSWQTGEPLFKNFDSHSLLVILCFHHFVLLFNAKTLNNFSFWIINKKPRCRKCELGLVEHKISKQEKKPRFDSLIPRQSQPLGKVQSPPESMRFDKQRHSICY